MIKQIDFSFADSDTSKTETVCPLSFLDHLEVNLEDKFPELLNSAINGFYKEYLIIRDKILRAIPELKEAQAKFDLFHITECISKLESQLLNENKNLYRSIIDFLNRTYSLKLLIPEDTKGNQEILKQDLYSFLNTSLPSTDLDESLEIQNYNDYVAPMARRVSERRSGGYKLKNNVISFDDLFYISDWIADTLYISCTSGREYTAFQYSVIKYITGEYDLKDLWPIPDHFKTPETYKFITNEKIESIKLFKNGRWDLRFHNSEFAHDFLKFLKIA